MSFATFGFAPDWPAPGHVHAWVTERGGDGRYGAGNLGAHVGDDASVVAANRVRLRAELTLPAEPCWLTQVHGARVLDLDREAVATADGAVTSRTGIVCAVLTADCLSVLLCDRAGRRVGVAHTG
ncbi:MAG TPA: laccase domain-containing protein, partial [Gammaproteobacteria bacterium]|nr:laccase domain-containing protein [Gammaproteobacteria bacterium]